MLRSTSVPIMVTIFTGISEANIIKKLDWKINQLKPIRSLRHWNIMVIEKDLILRNIIKVLRRPLLIWHMLDRTMSLMKTRRFYKLRMVCRMMPQSDTTLMRKLRGISYWFPNRLLINSTICSVLVLASSDLWQEEKVINITRIRNSRSKQQ